MNRYTTLNFHISTYIHHVLQTLYNADTKDAHNEVKLAHSLCIPGVSFNIPFSVTCRSVIYYKPEGIRIYSLLDACMICIYCWSAVKKPVLVNDRCLNHICGQNTCVECGKSIDVNTNANVKNDLRDTRSPRPARDHKMVRTMQKRQYATIVLEHSLH